LKTYRALSPDGVLSSRRASVLGVRVPMKNCPKKQDIGWKCSLKAGHSGPCAPVKKGPIAAWLERTGYEIFT
jgi:hypothetical protein